MAHQRQKIVMGRWFCRLEWFYSQIASLEFSFSISLDISTMAAVACLLPFVVGITCPLDCDKTVRTVVTSRIHKLAQ